MIRIKQAHQLLAGKHFVFLLSLAGCKSKLFFLEQSLGCQALRMYIRFQTFLNTVYFENEIIQ